MTNLEEFNKKKEVLTKALEAAMLRTIENNPAGFCEWLGMTYTSPTEDSCDEEFIKSISTGA